MGAGDEANGAGDGPGLSFYFRQGCHLCDDMWLQLCEQPRFAELHIERLDVDQDPQLQARYGTLIPVLAAGDEVICHYYLDPDALSRYLDRA